MLHGLFIASFITSCHKIIKDILQPTISAEYRANKELLDKDIMSGVPYSQLQKNVRSGKYKLTEVQQQKHPEPHKDANGKIIVENNLLYKQDLKKYGAVQTYKWAKQGKYNLTPEELKREKERIKKHLDDLYGL